MIERGARGVLGVGLLLAVVTGCGSGDQHDGHTVARMPTATPAVSAAETTTAAPITSGAAVAIGEVPGNPNAAKALQPWVRDLTGQDLDTLVRKCWTIEPQNARTMYGDKDAILAAVAQPGVDGQFAVIWKGPVQTVSVKRSEIASGYACPRVYATGSDAAFDDADARYAVRRYLSRWVGKPVNADDVEGKYPLVCAGSVLANNPGRLTGTTGFGEMTTAPSGISDVLVTVPVTNSSGVTQPMVFTVAIGSEGYCINDISG
ncbi:hypothetical protein ABZ319_35065 [Nocardia sp. NPDC005978]|uniref:hypothetical protein n=1 Tax=Nocardia sp. NPDC005978 TaxID=3156725 RepID=UPI0033BBF1E0